MFFRSRRQKEVDRLTGIAEDFLRRIADRSINSDEQLREELAKLPPTPDAIVVKAAIDRQYPPQTFHIKSDDPNELAVIASELRKAGVDVDDSELGPIPKPDPPPSGEEGT